MTMTAANRVQAMDLAAEAEQHGVSVDRLALVNGVHSEKVIALARQLHELIDEVHRATRDFATDEGFTPDEAEVAFQKFLEALMPPQQPNLH